jgi:hypothetical protein
MARNHYSAIQSRRVVGIGSRFFCGETKFCGEFGSATFVSVRQFFILSLAIGGKRVMIDRITLVCIFAVLPASRRTK